MSIFSSILSKLGIGGASASPSQDIPVGKVLPASATAPAPSAAPPVDQPAASAAPASISPVDVVSKLEAMAKGHSEPLNWKTSIVDLLKLLGLDSSLAARKELATELHCPADKMGGLGTDEHVAAQDGPAETGRQRRQHSEGVAGLTSLGGRGSSDTPGNVRC